MPTSKDSFKIFSLAGIGVYVHWSWLLAVCYFVGNSAHGYSSLVWNVAECLALFLIVLIHEFGHQLACRSVGGQTHDIVLWPLGGVAYVSPPQRPGAQLWSIVAGPLVNVVLVPIFSVFVSISWHSGWYDTHPDLYEFLHNVWRINVVLLVFNLIPMYPLDGGQILRSLLWFPFGRATSLVTATVIGFVILPMAVVYALKFHWISFTGSRGIWNGVMALFVLLNCWAGFRNGMALLRLAKLPRRDGFACPSCKAAPPIGDLWRCAKCSKPFDTFITQAACPHCGAQFNATQCLDCGTAHPIDAWSLSPETS